MIRIYFADAAGRLFTDEKRHFYVDAETLKEHATKCRIRAAQARLAARLGFSCWDSLTTSCACSGVSSETLYEWIASGNLDHIRRL